METTEIKLIKAYKKYINFLSNEYFDAFSFAHIHGYKCSEENIKLGEQMRNAIKELENECAVPDNDVLMDYLY
jgi:hypothetical protein